MAFKKTSVFPEVLCLTQMDGITIDFHSQILWGLLFLVLVLWAQEPSVDLGPLASQGGTTAAKISLPIFNCHTRVWDQPVLCLYPSYQSRSGFFVISLVIGLLFSQCSGTSPGRSFYNLVVILMWSWEEVSIVSTNSTIWAGSPQALLIVPSKLIESFLAIQMLVFAKLSLLLIMCHLSILNYLFSLLGFLHSLRFLQRRCSTLKWPRVVPRLN